MSGCRLHSIVVVVRTLRVATLSGCSSVDRVLASEAKGRGFDPRQPRQQPASFLENHQLLKNFP